MASDKQSKKARRARELYDVGLDYDLPQPFALHYQDASMAADAKRLEAWVNDVNGLIAEHKGRVGGMLHVVLCKRDQCSLCHNPWELGDDGDQPPFCAYCGAEAETDGG